MAEIKQKDRAVFLNAMLRIYIGMSKKVFETDPNQKKAPKAELKTKIWGCTFTKSIMQFKSFSKSAF